ncbi:MAG: MerR family transcriptional regulator [SAR202 cluster bacterium]|nr:MerR family transcriptional regulator [SAR202 cluster bacterium]|tara:strand:+ start:25 stop:504 length:480 start_codon:yes stop_codon:yes gene_type:complete
MSNDSGNMTTGKESFAMANSGMKEILDSINSLNKSTRLPAEVSPNSNETFDGLYIISVAARIVHMHPQTLRKYEKVGLVQPSRTIGMLRLYSESDIQKLRLIKRLISELKLNLAGVELALAIFERLNDSLSQKNPSYPENSQDFELAKKDIFEIFFGRE